MVPSVYGVSLVIKSPFIRDSISFNEGDADEKEEPKWWASSSQRGHRLDTRYIRSCRVLFNTLFMDRRTGLVPHSSISRTYLHQFLFRTFFSFNIFEIGWCNGRLVCKRMKGDRKRQEMAEEESRIARRMIRMDTARVENRVKLCLFERRVSIPRLHTRPSHSSLGSGQQKNMHHPHYSSVQKQRAIQSLSSRERVVGILLFIVAHPRCRGEEEGGVKNKNLQKGEKRGKKTVILNVLLTLVNWGLSEMSMWHSFELGERTRHVPIRRICRISSSETLRLHHHHHD